MNPLAAMERAADEGRPCVLTPDQCREVLEQWAGVVAEKNWLVRKVYGVPAGGWPVPGAGKGVGV